MGPDTHVVAVMLARNLRALRDAGFYPRDVVEAALALIEVDPGPAELAYSRECARHADKAAALATYSAAADALKSGA